MVDPQVEEIKELLRQNMALSQATYKQVHKMRRSQLWGRAFMVLWWVAIFAISGYTYYYYAQPYVDKLEQLYAQLGQTTVQAQNYQSEISGFFGNLMQQSGLTPTSTATTTKK